MSELRVLVGFDAPRDLWLAVVVRENEIMTLGFEPTEKEAAEWGVKAMKARAWEKGVDDPPDVYARAALGEKE
jgi:hypothetical protein